MKPVRVLQFITPAGFYGAERWVIALANNIDRASVICDLAVSEEGGSQDLSLLDYFPDDVGQIHRIRMRGRFDLRAIDALCTIIRERNIDVIHTHGYKSDILGLIAAKRSGIRCISTPHGFAGKVGIKLATFIHIGVFALRFFDAVAPLSEQLIKDMQRFRVPQKKTRFIRNGVDLKEIDQSLEVMGSNDRGPTNQEPDTTFTIGFIGQMIPRKGIPELLAVFDSLYRKHAHIRLVLVGDGAQRAELEQLAGSLDSREAIQFLGFRDDRLALLKNFDLFVMTSSLEGIPRCMMEAMAVGTPVVAYDIPGVDQLVEDGVTGLLAPLGDRDQLERCCEAVIGSPEQARERARAARQLIDDRYSGGRMAREYETLFLELRDNGKLTEQAKGTLA